MPRPHVWRRLERTSCCLWMAEPCAFNRALDACKLGGAVLFCVGGAGVAAGLLLLAACGQGGAKHELRLQRRFKERLAEIQASVPNPGDAKVPVTLSKVQNIQPGADP
ncbi:hypothetical protein PHYPO_G00004770 [Pangasianodon hypophthalmus]|uniref:Uncharacterized protein n=1 Tax=Pangasianodon hypophthalmus TaxID=310915 RepID=A0A5N5Q4B5_PANHP|nr:hypothetical protein PHYPO_G00004770 [Pangasianodon hypophthalmus]